MVATFLICVAYALAGTLYAPRVDSLVAFAFIGCSSAPLLLAARKSLGLPKVLHPTPGALFFSALITAGMANLAWIALGLERSPLELLSPEGFLLTAAAATAKRYQDEGASGNPILLALSLFLVYRVGGASNRLRVWQQAVAFLPLLLYTALSTEKWPMFLSGAFYIAGLFAAFNERQALRRMATVVALFVFIGTVVAGVAMFLRGFDGDVLELPAQLLHYVLAPFPAFGSWLLSSASDQCCSGGTYTFIGLANPVGMVRREAGVFPENFSIYGQETNIYSAWRYLVQDFSIVGPVLINTGAALLYLKCLERSYFAAARALTNMLILSAVMSLNVTPFVHNSVALAATLALAYSALCGMSRRSRTLHRLYEQTRIASL